MSSDYEEVYKLVKVAFAMLSHADGTEPNYFNKIRKKDIFISELSLLVENTEGKLVWRIVLYSKGISLLCRFPMWKPCLISEIGFVPFCKNHIFHVDDKKKTAE